MAEEFQLTLKVEGKDAKPAAVRLRRLLKFALRTCGLRCVRCVAVADDQIEPTRKKELCR